MGVFGRVGGVGIVVVRHTEGICARGDAGLGVGEGGCGGEEEG